MLKIGSYKFKFVRTVSVTVMTSSPKIILKNFMPEPPPLMVTHIFISFHTRFIV